MSKPSSLFPEYSPTLSAWNTVHVFVGTEYKNIPEPNVLQALMDARNALNAFNGSGSRDAGSAVDEAKKSLGNFIIPRKLVGMLLPLFGKTYSILDKDFPNSKKAKALDYVNEMLGPIEQVKNLNEQVAPLKGHPPTGDKIVELYNRTKLVYEGLRNIQKKMDLLDSKKNPSVTGKERH